MRPREVRGRTPRQRQGAGRRCSAEKSFSKPDGDAVDIRSVLTELSEAFNAHDLDRIMTFFSDDCILEMPRGNQPWGARFEGRRNVRAALATRFDGLPDAHWGDARHFVTDDRGVSEWTFTGTLMDGTRVEVTGCDLFTFRNGEIAIKNSFRKNRPPVG